MPISVITCCYNSALRLPETIKHLAHQNLPADNKWEILIINNNSTDNTVEVAHEEWAKYQLANVHFRVINESTPGLSYARKRGIEEAKYPVLVFCDDDNSLNEDYLQEAENFLKEYKYVGIVGCKSIASYEVPPPSFFARSGISLGCSDKGDKVLVSACKGVVNKYPEICPIGTGMVMRKEVALLYSNMLNKSGSTISDRKGDSLSGGGDNEMNIIALKNGWEVAYNPAMQLTHIITAKRLTLEYLCKMGEEGSRSWVLLLNKYNMCPWPKIAPWTEKLRKTKAYFDYKAWRSPENRIKWKGACGIIAGIAKI